MKRLAAAALLATAATATACVPPPAPQTCAQAVDRIWPAASRGWAHRGAVVLTVDADATKWAAEL